MNESKCLYKGGGNMEKISLDFAKSHVENSHCGSEVIYWTVILHYFRGLLERNQNVNSRTEKSTILSLK